MLEADNVDITTEWTAAVHGRGAFAITELRVDPNLAAFIDLQAFGRSFRLLRRSA